MAHLNYLLKAGDAELPGILAALYATADEVRSALKASQTLLRGQGAVSNKPESATLPHTLYELSRAAQSLRALADYLNSHPNALIFGKKS